VFLNRRGDRMRTLVCDGFGICLTARRLHEGRLTPGSINSNTALTHEQFDEDTKSDPQALSGQLSDEP